MQEALSPMPEAPRRRWSLLAAVGLLGWAGGRVLRRRYGRLCEAHIAARLPAIQESLDVAGAGFVFVCGDSHAELLCAHPFGAHEVVNGGIGGISTGTYAASLPRLHFRERPGTAVLIIGSNDISARGRPLSDAAFTRFEAAAMALMCWLRVHADRVVVVALPPIVQVALLKREPAAVQDYSARLERLARQCGCLFADPFAALRAGPEGLARPGALVDGVHLADYGPVAAALAAPPS